MRIFANPFLLCLGLLYLFDSALFLQCLVLHCLVLLHLFFADLCLGLNFYSYFSEKDLIRCVVARHKPLNRK